MKPLRIFWGLLILFIGIIFLAVNTGLIATDVWTNFILFWPILIVLFGLGLILRNSFIYFLVAVIMIAATFYFALSDPYNWQKEEENKAQILAQNFVQNYDSSINNCVLSLDLGAAVLNVESIDDPDSNSLLRGNYEGMKDFEVIRNDTGGTSTISIKEKSTEKFVLNNLEKRRSMNLSLSNRLPFEFRVNSGASKVDLDFSDVSVKKLTLNAGASKVNVKLGNKIDEMESEVNAGASDLTLTIPKDYGLKIESNSVLLGKNFGGIELEKSEKNNYETKGFNESKKKITINLSSGVSKLSLNTY